MGKQYVSNLLKPDEKVRNILFLVYLEDISSYGDLLAFLDSLHIECACSCVHDRDTFTKGDVLNFVRNHMNQKTGKLDASEFEGIQLPTEGQHKKPHIHVLLRFSGPVTALHCHKLLKPFVNIAPNRFMRCNSVHASLRYFAHLDNPEKAQYGALSVKGFGGIDLSVLLKTSKVSNVETLMDIIDYISSNNITDFHTLVHWALRTADFDVFCCVTGRASFFASYFGSMNAKNNKKDTN